jgi:hypothetical protein
MLDGSASYDPDDDTITYTWRVITAPMGSGGDSTIYDVQLRKPSFSPDKKGVYVIGLIVNDGKVDSVEDTMKSRAQQPAGGRCRVQPEPAQRLWHPARLQTGRQRKHDP